MFKAFIQKKRGVAPHNMILKLSYFKSDFKNIAYTQSYDKNEKISQNFLYENFIKFSKIHVNQSV